VGARRTQSLPSKYMMPSENMGEYDSGAQRRRSAPAKPADRPGLYPLGEEGTYGRPPAAPAPPAPPTPRRERKPKLYSSYAVDSKCNVHAKKLAKVEQQREREQEEARARRRRSISMANRRNVSASPSRASSEARSRSSKSPDPCQPPNGYLRRKSSFGSADASGRKMTPTATGYSQSSRYSSSSNSHKFSGIREEKEEYSYSNARKSSGYSKYASNNDAGLSNGMNGMSLGGLKKPQIDSWDSMGILGLSSRMWSSTSKKQETFMSSTGMVLREENNSYIM